jgi:hypothetical protein
MSGRTASAAADRFILTTRSARRVCLATHRSMAVTSSDRDDGPLPMVTAAPAKVRPPRRAIPAIGLPATIDSTSSRAAAERRRPFASPGACR